MKTIDEIQAVVDKAECIYDEQAIVQALDDLAIEITAKLHDKNPLILCVMTGALIPTGHLLTRLMFPLEVDYLHVTRYRGTTRGGDLHWLVEPRRELKDRVVLVVDDIMDGGLTLSAILDYCRQADAKECYSAVLINKIRKREPGVDFEPDFSALDIQEDKYVYGFGLDYEEYLRNVPGIYAVAKEHQ